MEYIFGRDPETGEEILRTKGSVHTNLSGTCFWEDEQDTCVIEDAFFVVGKLDSKEDPRGDCYDWYSIEKHMRTVDMSRSVNKKLDVMIATALGGAT